MKYDIFISYRREGGYETAKHIFDLLDRDNYKVSFDIDTLRNGDFDIELFKRIDECVDFIIILNKGVFDRCFKLEKKNDWLRNELAYALKMGKNIIPIMLNGFNEFPENLPDDIAKVVRKNGPKYNQEYFDAFYEKLKSDFLESKPLKKQLDNNDYSKIIGIKNPILQGILDNMILVEGGDFMMGSNEDAVEGVPEWKDNEKPIHRRKVDSFYICRYQTTQKQWKEVMGAYSYLDFKGNDNLPAEKISWNNAQEFIDKLNLMTGLHFRLPTEVEWEFAAKGGVKSKGYRFSGSNSADDVARYNKLFLTMGPHIVGSKCSNELGIYDMSGNVEEWCSDFFKPYPNSSIEFQKFSDKLKSYRVYRGGSWNYKSFRCRVTNRGSSLPDVSYFGIGFRLCMDIENKKTSR
ncbi:MAG: SUMF1/EgtB/PvdO family nonheme iron enzyme [Bacteroidetes bacterium]|nr:SUMF1/EgtB/PvdO family nonheme iron enzyme [Bacteroidota bacterium]